MSTEDTIGECSICRAIMNFVSFIDRETKKEMGSGFVDKPTPFLLKPLRKYRCSNGHEETKE